MELQVGVKVLMKNSDEKYLMLRRSSEKYPEAGGTWDLPGGRIEKGIGLFENLKREVAEETGLALISTPTLIAAQDIFVGSERHVVRLTYRADAPEGDITLDETENDAYAWLSEDEFKTHESLDKYVQQLSESNELWQA